jgi:DNA-binding transcriptional ArsR family regulator
MIKVRLTVGDATRTRFAYSPLSELAQTLFILSTRQVHSVHREWHAEVRHRLSGTDLSLLTALMPPHNVMPDFFFCGTGDAGTTIEDQLAVLEEAPIEEFRQDVGGAWRLGRIPATLASTLKDDAATRRVADALYTYWNIALRPHWHRIRAGLDDDVAYRAQAFAQRGLAGLMAAIHPEVALDDDELVVDKPQWRHTLSSYDLGGAGLRLVPSAFAWPRVGFATAFDNRPVLVYPVRGVGTLWGAEPQRDTTDDPLAMLLGRSRAAILRRLSLARSTTQLAVELDQRPPGVSQHLSVLRRSGLVISWRSGKSVLYRRTSLADSVVSAASTGEDCLAR